MFNLAAIESLLSAKPFVPFRIWLSDGGHVDVLSREVVIVGRQFAVIGLLDPNTTGIAVDRYTTVWYLHITRHEMLAPGARAIFPAVRTEPVAIARTGLKVFKLWRFPNFLSNLTPIILRSSCQKTAPGRRIAHWLSRSNAWPFLCAYAILQPGQTVAIVLPNGLEYLALSWPSPGPA